MKRFVDSEKLDLPVVLGRASKDETEKLLMTKGELRLYGKDHEGFLAALGKNASGEGIALDIQSKNGDD